MKQKIKQIIYDMRHQPVFWWVSVLATAMSIFLIMVIVMIQRVGVVPFAPESCRNRLLIGMYIHIVGDKDGRNSTNSSSGSMSFSAAHTLYDNLDGVEQISFMSNGISSAEVVGTTNDMFEARTRRVDAGFFKIFDHPLQAGRYYTVDEANALQPLVVISESVARRAFGTVDCEGMQLSVNHKKYTVTGVVNNNSVLALSGSGEVFIATGPGDKELEWDTDFNVFGDVAVAMLVKEGVDLQHVRDQVKARYAILDTELAPEEMHTVYHGTPYDQETIASGARYSNADPNPDSDRHLRYWMYAILLIVPAINLSSMLHSRMRRRVRELGVRRAYGCTRSRIITDILVENFIMTLLGGTIGVTCGVIFALTYSGLYENMDNFGSYSITPAMSAVLNWGTVFVALAVCFILNLISASIPAWRASRLNPVEAINSK